MTNFYAQYKTIEPWLQKSADEGGAAVAETENKQSKKDRWVCG